MNKKTWDGVPPESHQIYTVKERGMVWLHWLTLESEAKVARVFGRDAKAIEMLVWRIVTNYLGQGDAVANYIRSKNLELRNDHKEWNSLDCQVLTWWKDSYDGPAPLRPRNAAALLGRTRNALEIQYKFRFGGLLGPSPNPFASEPMTIVNVTGDTPLT